MENELPLRFCWLPFTTARETCCGMNLKTRCLILPALFTIISLLGLTIDLVDDTVKDTGFALLVLIVVACIMIAIIKENTRFVKYVFYFYAITLVTQIATIPLLFYPLAFFILSGYYGDAIWIIVSYFICLVILHSQLSLLSRFHKQIKERNNLLKKSWEHGESI
uniref:Uncharacterized protein n=1 Tax=Cacopsylla melanoneura TaxID=428564 RepID=A0A8D8RCQ4_9HEMI